VEDKGHVKARYDKEGLNGHGSRQDIDIQCHRMGDNDGESQK
jgi:hypothetical protein